jgi:hypothetical protein
MHLTRLVMLAEWLEAGAPEKDNVTRFSMTNWIVPQKNSCGTACCIAGATVQFFNDEARTFKSEQDVYNASLKGVQEYARGLLDLTKDQANDLFYANEYFIVENEDALYYSKALKAITPAHAARVIRKFIATGEIDYIGCEA